ncbi:MAG: DUF2764 family protein [Bacteroidales bacterium]
MRKEYHYLVAGLPDLFFDASKLNFSVSEFKNYLHDELEEDDYRLIESYFWRYDNQNLLDLLNHKEDGFIKSGNLNREDFEMILDLAKDDSLRDYERNIPDYFGWFIQMFKADSSVNHEKSNENRLTDRYYDYLLQTDNRFFREWYEFELNLNNLMTAAYCKKFEIPVEPQLIGSGEINEKLIKSNARDFGIGNEFPKIDHILRAIEETDLLEKEKKIDLIKWELLDERTFFHYFTVEKVFAYALKTDMIERWIKLDKKTGEELFNKLLGDLEGSRNLSEEFGQ